MNEPEEESVIGQYRIVPLTTHARSYIGLWHYCTLPKNVDRPPIRTAGDEYYLIVICDSDAPQSTRPALPPDVCVPTYQMSFSSKMGNGGIIECYIAPDCDEAEQHFRGYLAEQFSAIPNRDYQILRVYKNGYVRCSPRSQVIAE